MRVLGIELRRSAAPVLGGLVVVLLLGLLFWLPPAGKGSTAWTRQWWSMAEWVRYALVFAWPLTVGAGAVQGLRDRRSGVEELFASTPRPRAQRAARTLAALAVALLVAYLVVVVVGGVQVAAKTGHLGLGWVPVALVGLLSLVAAAWLGMGVGRLLPSPLTPPLLAVGAMALMVVAEAAGDEGYPFVLLRPSATRPGSVFAHTAGSVSAGQALWFGGMAVAGVLLFALRRWWSGVLPLLAGAALALPLLPTTSAEATAADPAAAELACADGLCLTRAHERERAALAGPAREALALLSKLPAPPTEVRELPNPVRPEPRGPEPTDTVWLDLDDLVYFRSTPLPATRITELLVEGAGTRECNARDSSPHREVVARAVTTAWLTGHLTPLRNYLGEEDPELNPLAQQALTTLNARPAADQRAHVEAARQSLAACTGTAWTALTGEPA
ncbi:hypothetical protein [Actinokineospora spheciospongiae]|uniref:hypothetical protein n=1 Tax=Actinokineospora spheciospongiae TaxID=909613 RepID=UPI000D716023|nr:hypothetical protein [Actinokineospora spheciospongiae]PWW66737.1 hypothetical protein DFQ13_101253 [Actinokineospora spheciospongiae]